MIKRFLLPAALIGAVLLGTCGAFAQDREPQARGGLVNISGGTVEPGRVQAGGGSVTVRVRVTPKKRNVRITSVSARAILRDERGAAGRLRHQGGGRYEGTIVVPANNSTGAEDARVMLIVETNRGRVTRKIGEVTVAGEGRDPNRPPDPPNI